MLKFNVGQKVRVRSDLIFDDEFNDYYVSELVYNLRGRVLKIKAIDEWGDGYVVHGVENEAFFVDEMLEDLPVDETDICGKCGKSLDSHVVYDKFGNQYCEDCAKEMFVQCAGSGNTIDLLNDNYVEHDGKIYASTWFYSNYTKCDLCGEYHLNSEIEKLHDNRKVCAKCIVDNGLIKCEHCGNYFTSDLIQSFEGSRLCASCVESMLNNVIKGYHEFGDWELRTTGNEDFYTHNNIGFELEVERHNSGVSRNLQAYRTLKTANDLVVIERDGSLHNGFEIISHPMSYDYIRSNKDLLKDILDELKNANYQGDEVSTAGLHFHVDKKLLATTSRSMDQVIDNILLIVETFKKELEVFARRKSNDYCNFLTASREMLNLKKIKKIKDTSDRYLAVNLSNYKTIEFRMFKSTVDYKTFMASIELVNNIVNISKYEDLQDLSWSDIVNYKKHLNSFIMEYSDSLNIVSDIKVNVLSDLELYADKFTLKNFVKTGFAIEMDGMDRAHVNILAGILMTEDIKPRENFQTLRANLLDYYYNRKTFYVDTIDGAKTLRVRVSRDINIVPLSDLIDLYEYRTDLLH